MHFSLSEVCLTRHVSESTQFAVKMKTTPTIIKTHHIYRTHYSPTYLNTITLATRSARVWLVFWCSRERSRSCILRRSSASQRDWSCTVGVQWKPMNECLQKSNIMRWIPRSLSFMDASCSFFRDLANWSCAKDRRDISWIKIKKNQPIKSWILEIGESELRELMS